MGHAGLRHPIDARLSSLKSDVSSARRKRTSSNSGAPPCPWKEAPANRPSYETGRNSKTEPAGRPTGPLRPLPGGTCWTRTETEPVTVIHTVKLPSYEKERRKEESFFFVARGPLCMFLLYQGRGERDGTLRDCTSVSVCCLRGVIPRTSHPHGQVHATTTTPSDGETFVVRALLSKKSEPSNLDYLPEQCRCRSTHSDSPIVPVTS